MNAIWVAALIIFIQGHGPMSGLANHEPFETEQACKDWIDGHPPTEQIAKMIDEGTPIIGHASVCIVPEKDGRPA